MARRTSPSDAREISGADEIEDAVRDKRAGWRASAAKGRRRQRRYKKLLTDQLMRHVDGDEA
jgi:hypothetical protein